MPTVEVVASSAATVNEDTPSTPDPGSSVLRINNNSTTDELNVYIDIAKLVPIGEDATVVSATLRLFKSEAWPAAAPDVRVYRLAEPWDSSTVTWDDAITTVGTYQMTNVAGVGAAGDAVDLTITTLLQSAVDEEDAGTASWYGLMVLSNTGAASDVRRFYGVHNDPTLAPRLLVEWSVAPDPPEDLQPNGGRAVSEVRPELRGSFYDQDADDTISAIRVQVDNADDFATPVYDSAVTEVVTFTEATNITAGTYTVTFGGQTTTAIAWNASAATLQTTLEALSSIGTGNILVTGMAGGLTAAPATLTFAEDLERQDVGAVTSNQAGLTGTFTIAVGTAGHAEVDHTAASFDMASPPTGATTVGDLTAGVPYYWRMMVWDNHDLASEWSEVAQFVITAKGTLTMTLPAAGALDNPVPTVTWGLAGATQVAYSVDVEEKVGGVWVTHYALSKTIGTTTTAAIPLASALQPSKTYRFIVRSWDSADREDMAGDRSFYQDDAEVTT